MNQSTYFPLIVSLLFTSPFSQSEATNEDVEARNPRKWGLSAEVGINSLSSLVGPVATVYVKPKIALDLGVGLSSNGLRPGLRTRYLFTTDRLAYFGGIGLKHGLGSNGQDIEVEDPDTKKKVKIQLKSCTFLDLMVGLDFMANNGFMILGSAGYSALLGGKTYSVSPGYSIGTKTKDAFDLAFGSGILFSISLGKAF